MKRFFKTFLALLMSLGAISFGPIDNACAAELEEFYTGVRQMGMGGAYAAVVNDETAVLTNPAGLGKVRDTTLTIIDPEMTGAFTNTDVARLDNAIELWEIQGLLDALNTHKGLHWNAKIQVFPSLIGTNFGIGFHGKHSYNAEVDPTGTTFRLDYVNDYAAAAGYALRLFGGIVKIGVSVRGVDRTEIRKDIPANSTGLTVESQASEGFGVAGDVGLILAAPIRFIPTLAIVARDVGNTSYTLTDGIFHSTALRPIPTPQTIDVGLAMFPIAGNRTRWTLTADYHDILKAYEDETDTFKRIHVGAEMNLHDFFFLRMGMNQKYWTAGIELASERFQLQLASYGEDIGTSADPEEDRRWVSKFVFRF